MKNKSQLKMELLKAWKDIPNLTKKKKVALKNILTRPTKFINQLENRPIIQRKIKSPSPNPKKEKKVVNIKEKNPKLKITLKNIIIKYSIQLKKPMKKI